MNIAQLVLKPIAATYANAFVRKHHYSGKVVPNSQLHFGVFHDGELLGVMQFGPSMDKRKAMALVADTKWNEFVELNRMAFSERLPKNSESRCIAIALRLLKKHSPHIKWVISYADATLCGDGTIYRASNFILTGIKRNTSTYKMPSGEVVNKITASAHRATEAKGSAGVGWLKAQGAVLQPGFQLRYVYFLDKASRAKLTVPEVPYAEIERQGARMYKGVKFAPVV